MPKIVETRVNQFDGGIADDLRKSAVWNGEYFTTSEFALTKHFDVYSKKGQLIPYRDMEAEAGTLGAYDIESVLLFTDSGGTQNLFALGNVDGQTYPQFLEKSTNMVTGTFAASTGGNSTAGTVLPKTLVGYPRTNLMYCMKTSGGNTLITSYNPVTDALVETVGTITGTSSSTIYPRPFRHPLDDILYFGADNVVATLNNTTFTAAALTLPEGLTITSFTDYGVYLAIACAPKNAAEKSIVFLWNRDTSLTTVQETIDWGVGALMVLENVAGSLVGISAVTQLAAAGETLFQINPKLVFREYTGGLARPFKEVRRTDTSTAIRLENLKAKQNDALFFAASIYYERQTINQTWVVFKNSRGRLVVTADRLANNDTALTGNVDGLDIIGDYAWTPYDGDGALNRTNDAATFTAAATYDSVIFNAGDSALFKTLRGITVTFEPLPAAGVVNLFYRKDAETVFTRILTYGTDDGISRGAVNVEIGSDTVTMTIASPAVVTLTNHDLVAGQAIRFQTTGALPTGVTAGTTYYVISAGLAADSFRFSATSGGSAVNTSGTQSGTHTVERDANLPSHYREIQYRIESTGAAVITGFSSKEEVIDLELY